MPDRKGKLADVVLGFDSAAGYQGGSMYGAVVGRYANRIGDARFTLEGKTYQLTANSGPNNIHSGPNGFNTRIYSATPLDGPDPALILHLISPDGDQGFSRPAGFHRHLHAEGRQTRCALTIAPPPTSRRC